MEFTRAEVPTLPHGEQMADIYERGLIVARQMPRSSLRSIGMSATTEKAQIVFEQQWLLRERAIPRFRSDVARLSAIHLPDVSVRCQGRPPAFEDQAKGYYSFDLPHMRDGVWSALQEHWELIRQLPFAVKSIQSLFQEPSIARLRAAHGFSSPLISTKVSALVTSTEEKIGMYEWAHNNGLEDDGALSAMADSVPRQSFRLGEGWLNPPFGINIFDCTPDGWRSQEEEEQRFYEEYPGGIIPGINGPLPENPDEPTVG